MKYSFVIIFVLLVVFSSCERKTKSNDSPPEDNKSTDSVSETIERYISDSKNELYDFLSTDDKKFCNSDLIIPTDCGGGNLYFAKEGNVFYTFFCMGQDSTTYYIGRYSLGDSSVRCVFDKRYAFYDPSEPTDASEPIKVDPNNGKLKSIKSFTIELEKLQCEKFDYSFEFDGINYVLQKSNTDNLKFFFSRFKKIKAFDNM